MMTNWMSGSDASNFFSSSADVFPLTSPVWMSSGSSSDQPSRFRQRGLQAASPVMTELRAMLVLGLTMRPPRCSPGCSIYRMLTASVHSSAAAIAACCCVSACSGIQATTAGGSVRSEGDPWPGAGRGEAGRRWPWPAPGPAAGRCRCPRSRFFGAQPFDGDEICSRSASRIPGPRRLTPPANSRLMSFRKYIEGARSKRIAHTDLDAQLVTRDSLGAFPKNAEHQFLKNLEDFLNIAYGHVTNGQSLPIDVAMATDTHRLVRAMAKSVIFDQCSKCGETDRITAVLDYKNRLRGAS